jgi:hypothetical protein
MNLLWSCFLCGLSALLVDFIPYSQLFPYWFVPVADTLVGHGALAGIAWTLGTGAWVSTRGGSGSWGAGSSNVAWADAALCARGTTHFLKCAFECVAPRGPATLGAILYATIIAVAVDIDHFIAARSLRLRDALSLTARPFGHAIGAPFVGVAFTALAARVGIIPTWAPILVALSWLSHLTHDAVKRGFLLTPFFSGSTPLLPYLAYVAALAITPALVASALTALAPPLRAPPAPFTA